MLLALSLWAGASHARKTYIAHAEALLANPPGGAEIDPNLERQLLKLLNDYRESKGKSQLKAASDELVLAARAHALDLLATGKMGHVSSTGHDFESRMRALKGGGVLALPRMAENAARDRRTGVGRADKAEALMQQWIKSASHRKSMVDRNYLTVAIGAVASGDTVYAVQIFVGPEVKSNLFQGN